MDSSDLVCGPTPTYNTHGMSVGNVCYTTGAIKRIRCTVMRSAQNKFGVACSEPPRARVKVQLWTAVGLSVFNEILMVKYCSLLFVLTCKQ